MANDDQDKKDRKQSAAPYVPFKTFLRLIKSCKETTVPQRIDATVLDKFSWSDRASLLPALKFLQLTDKEDMSTPALNDLVKSYNTPEWKTKLKEIVLSRYDEIINGLNVESSATRGQLEEKFKNVGPGVVGKCIRFYIAAANEAGIPLSILITKRQKTGTERKIQRKKQSPKESEKPNSDFGKEYSNLENLGFKEFILPIKGKQPVKIYVPEDITQDDWKRIKNMMEQITIFIETYFGFSLEGKKE